MYNGTQGRPPYVAVDGKVYDVSKSPYWKNGVHQESHRAGMDLTAALHASPHGEKVLQNMVQVGVLAPSKDIPAFLAVFLEHHPLFRRHPPPFLAHFPMAFLLGSAVLLLLNLFRPRVLYEQASFVILVMAAVSTPPAMATGFWSWWVIYALAPLPQVFYKISLSVTLVVVEIICLSIRTRQSFQRNARGWLYLGLLLYLAVAVLAIGYLGGVLTYGD